MDWLPEPYEDETLYSIMARLWHYLGRPRSSVLRRALMERRDWVALSRLPVQLDALTRTLYWRQRDVDRLIDRHTLYPFYTAFAPPEIREKVRRYMHASGAGPQNILGVTSYGLEEPRFLRFCPACSEEMMGSAGERWWRRIHQLPGIEVCAVHGVPLRDSIVDVQLGREQGFIIPDEQTCRASSAEALPRDRRVSDRLWTLARGAAGLLRSPPAALGSGERRALLMRSLREKGLVQGRREVNHTALRRAIRDYWGDLLDTVPGLAISPRYGRDWLTLHVGGSSPTGHPLRHLVVNGAIESLPAAGLAFGAGPWPCLNPLAEHFGSKVVTHCRRQRVVSGIRGRFSCSCGYIYSRAMKRDGSVSKARLCEFGPSMVRHVEAGLAAGKTITGLARQMGLQPAVFLNQAQRLGIRAFDAS